MLILPRLSDRIRAQSPPGLELAPRSFVPELGVWSPRGRPFCLVAEVCGKIVWRGHFRDRDELDVFCWSLFRGELERDEFARGLVCPTWNPELAEWPVVYRLAISVTTIGTGTSTSGATCSITVGVGGVPAGALIYVGTGETGTGIIGVPTVTDSVPNTYTQIDGGNANTNSNECRGSFQYAANVSALVNTNTISFTKQISGDTAVMDACYATGIVTVSPLDVPTKGRSLSTGASPSATTGTAAVAGELVFGSLAIATAGASTGFSQASTWTSQPAEAVLTGCGLDGGYKINPGTSGIAWAPTITSADYFISVNGFKPAAVAKIARGDITIMVLDAHLAMQ